jgi:uncharacterized protein (DUF302 family)
LRRPETIGDVIAERRLSVVGLPELKVIIQLGKPRDAEELFKDGKEAADAFCPFRILGVGDEHIHYAIGIDAIQALQLVMKAITAEIAVLSKQYEYTFRWFDDSGGDLGFPGIDL